METTTSVALPGHSLGHKNPIEHLERQPELWRRGRQPAVSASLGQGTVALGLLCAVHAEFPGMTGRKDATAAELFLGPVLSQLPPTRPSMHPCMPPSVMHTLEPCIQQGPYMPSLEQARSAPTHSPSRAWLIHFALSLGPNGPTLLADNHSTDLP